MKKRIFSSLGGMVVALAAHSFVANAEQSVAFQNTHSDFRKTVKLEEFTKGWQKSRKQVSESTARAYLAANASRYGLDADLSNLRFERSSKSLLGEQFYFQQVLDGVEVLYGEIVVSLSNDGEVMRVYNNTYPVKEFNKSFAKGRILSTNDAFDAAWNNIKVHGDLISAPKSKRVFRVSDDGSVNMIYLTTLNVSAPIGTWEQEVDAFTGKVLERQDLRLERKATAKVDPMFYQGPIADRAAAFDKFYSKQAKRLVAESFETANGQGLVFDPDPRTTLKDNTLQDNSPAAAFDAAYFERQLNDLSVENGVYKLEGPWVKVVDFESPDKAPSTSTTGKWTAKRGDNAFNDVMTYYHLDKSQRYMQSLGFVGERAIQGRPIPVDTNAVNGQDNSYFDIQDNRLAFGHGCVDDNEDSDVILHEYGHAINHSINTSFRGGDTGAMGEGFGDYWAASYSISHQNGLEHKVNEVFTWDGHGEGDKCWPGRVLNATEMQYNHAETYGAHYPVGRRQSDELWSTPTFQALLELVNQGVPREEVDQIVLEAQFGLAAGLKMRDMAQAIIATAKRLQPNGPHAGVFTKYFVAQGIVEIPRANLALGNIEVVDSNADNVFLPGETVAVGLSLKNNGLLAAENIKAEITSATEGIEIVNGTLSFDNIASSAEGTSANDFEVRIGSNVNCGKLLKLTIKITYSGGIDGTLEKIIDLQTGRAIGVAQSQQANAAIPDNNMTGVKSVMSITATSNVTPNFNVDINLKHSYIGDLIITLTSPSGKTVQLHNRTGSSTDDIIGNYPKNFTPAESFSKLEGQTLSGDWTLQVTDRGAGDLGNLVSWGINDVSSYECN